jgi:two-component system sensor histidine kinase RegB
MLPAEPRPDAARDVAGRAHVGLRWLIRLRWGAVALELLVIGAADLYLDLQVPVLPLLSLVGVTALSNLAALRLGTPATGLVAGALLALDIALLTTMLHLSGGALNPFSVAYLVYVALSAVVLGAAWTWSLTALSALGYGALLVLAPGAPADAHSSAHMTAHLNGMWWAFLLAAVLIAAFVVQLSRALEQREAELARVRDRAARNQRLASLSQLAAGAAHELSTPLADIAVAAGELERALRADAGRWKEQLADVALIREEVSRCRGILDQMASDAGTPRGESPAPLRIAELLREAVASLPSRLAARVETCVEPGAADAELRAPRRGLRQVVANLLTNAFDASGESTPVRLGARLEGENLRVAVEDEGKGVPPELLPRLTEPFVTSKPPGEGLGLGLFLARQLVEELGGDLRIESRGGGGTAVALRLPLERSR